MRHNGAMPRFLRSICLAGLALVLSAAGPQTFTRDELEAIEQEMAEARARLAEMNAAGSAAALDIRTLERDLLAAAADALRREEQASEAEKTLISLSLERREARARLLQDEAAYEDLIAALAATGRRRPPALIVSPGEAGTAIRRSVLMRETLPQLELRAGRIAAQIEALNELEAGIHLQQATLEAAEASIALRKEEIERLADAKRLQYEGLSGTSARLRSQAEALAREADTLRELLAALEAEAPRAPGVKPEPAAVLAVLRPKRSGPAVSPDPSAVRAAPLGPSGRAGLLQPVAGNVESRFGDRLAGGSRAEWISFRTRSEAQVTAPASGRVEYARPFRSYGSMLILRTSDGYHVILTGMSRIYVSEGQSVRAGEPVGRMPDRSTPPPELTLELRLGDRVLDPAEWIAGSD